MKALKWIGIGVGGFAAVVGLVIALVFTLTAGAAGAADELLSQLGRGQYETAYRSTTPQFQSQTSLDKFRATMERFGLDKFQSASWNSREISGGQSQIEGTVKTRDGRSVVVKVILVKIGDTWRVHGMDMRAGGAN